MFVVNQAKRITHEYLNSYKDDFQDKINDEKNNTSIWL